MTDAAAAALRLAGRLMSYPDADWLGRLDGLREEAAALAADANTVRFGQAALEFIDNIRAVAPAETAQCFVAIFDHTPAASLYMTWHRYGNDRSQGQAMSALNGLYRTAGFEPIAGEMPDYFPRMLEFLSIAPDWACEAILDGFGPEITALLQTLRELEAPQAGFLAAAIEPLQEQYPARFKPRSGPDPTKRPMARPEPEPLEPLLPIHRKDAQHPDSCPGEEI